MVDYPSHNMGHNPGPDDPMDLPEPTAEELDRDEVVERLQQALVVINDSISTMPQGTARSRAEEFRDACEQEGW